MVGCLYFSLYFTVMMLIGDLPEWLMVVNTVLFAISTIASIIIWEEHKSKVEELEEKIEHLKEFKEWTNE